MADPHFLSACPLSVSMLTPSPKLPTARPNQSPQFCQSQRSWPLRTSETGCSLPLPLWSSAA